MLKPTVSVGFGVLVETAARLVSGRSPSSKLLVESSSFGKIRNLDPLLGAADESTSFILCGHSHLINTRLNPYGIGVCQVTLVTLGSLLCRSIHIYVPCESLPVPPPSSKKAPRRSTLPDTFPYPRKGKKLGRHFHRS